MAFISQFAIINSQLEMNSFSYLLVGLRQSLARHSTIMPSTLDHRPSTLLDHIHRAMPVGLSGRVSKIVGLTVAVAGFPAPVGAVAKLEAEHGASVEAEIGRASCRERV